MERIERQAGAETVAAAVAGTVGAESGSRGLIGLVKAAFAALDKERSEAIAVVEGQIERLEVQLTIYGKSLRAKVLLGTA